MSSLNLDLLPALKLRYFVLLLASLAMAGAACSGGDSETAAAPATQQSARTTMQTRTILNETAAAFVIRVNTMLQNGGYGSAWDDLHPAQQVLVSATELAACVDAPAPPEATFKVTEAHAEPWPVSPSEQKRPSTAVTLRVVIASTDDGVTTLSVLETLTQHAFKVDGRWRWILNPTAIRHANAGTC
jgi:hypothetical protein